MPAPRRAGVKGQAWARLRHSRRRAGSVGGVCTTVVAGTTGGGGGRLRSRPPAVGRAGPWSGCWAAPRGAASAAAPAATTRNSMKNSADDGVRYPWSSVRARLLRRRWVDSCWRPPRRGEGGTGGRLPPRARLSMAGATEPCSPSEGAAASATNPAQRGHQQKKKKQAMAPTFSCFLCGPVSCLLLGMGFWTLA